MKPIPFIILCIATFNVQNGCAQKSSKSDDKMEILKACLATDKVDYMLLNRYGGTALIPACERGHTDVVKELLKIDGYPIDHVNNLGWTALMEAIVLGNGGQTQTHIVQLLVDAGCDVGIPDGNGISPLKHAKERGFND